MDRSFELTIAGEAVSCQARRQVKSPYDGRVVGEVPVAGPEQLERATEAAGRAASTMAALAPHQRVAILERMAAGLSARKAELAGIISDEAGKPIRYAEVEADRAAGNCIAAADAVKEKAGELIGIDSVAPGDGRVGLVRRFPLGPLAGISPFNFPLNLSVHKVAPAIAAGCPMVLKPASQTPMSAMVLQRVAAEAGLPDGGLSVLPAHRDVADAMIADERFKLLTFTGSAEVGWGMKARAGNKRVVLELGGNAAAIVGADADLETVVPKLVLGAFAYAGQICISVQRIFVMQPLFEAFVERFVRVTGELARVGDPADPMVMVGPMIDGWNRDRVIAWVDEAKAAGARLLCGGTIQDNCVTPTALTNTNPTMKVHGEEAFAPLTVIEPVADWDEAIALTNASHFGLQAAVFTNDINALWKCHEAIEVGGLIHNDSPLFRVDHMPYGGVKDSGFGREGPRYALEEMTEMRLLVLNPR